MPVHTPYSWLGPKRLLARSAMIGNAVFMVVLGFVVLTEPAHIPLTIACWLSAAAMVGLAVFTPLRDP